MMTDDVKTIRLDRMRYTKNLLSSRMCYLAILFNVLYFVTMYKINNNRFYEVLMGASVVYNLVFLLMCFLASEGVKNYKINYGYLLLGLGVGQVVRCFIFPAKVSKTITIVRQQKVGKRIVERTEEIAGALTPIQHILLIVFLSLSCACCITAGIFAIIRGKKLRAYQASLAETTL